MSEERVTFGTPQLDGRLYNPESATVGFILTHPHPKLGGNMHNNVVTSVSRKLQSHPSQSFATMRFNTRGVGKSKGWSTWTGKKEREDMMAAIQFLRGKENLKKVYLIGYSFGSAVGLSVSGVAGDLVDGYVAISYPRGFITSFIFKSHYALADSAKDKLFVIGTKDDFTGVSKLTSFYDNLSEPKTLEVVPGVDHFWFGRESELCNIIVSWLDKVLQPTDQSTTPS